MHSQRTETVGIVHVPHRVGKDARQTQQMEQTPDAVHTKRWSQRLDPLRLSQTTIWVQGKQADHI